MKNFFLRNPVIIDYLVPGIETESKILEKLKPYLQQRIVFLGNIPKEIDEVIEKIEIEIDKISISKDNTLHNKLKILTNQEKILESYYGTNWIKKLGFDFEKDAQKIIQGSGKEAKWEKEGKWEKFDTHNLSGGDDIFEIKELLPEKLEKEMKKEVKKEKFRTLIFIRNVDIFPEDRVSEFKEKIFLVSKNNKIPEVQPYKQHLFFYLNENANFQRRSNVLPMFYKVTLTGLVQINLLRMLHTFKTEKSTKAIENTSGINIETTHHVEEMVYNIPVDIDFYQNRELLKIDGEDYFTLMEDVFKEYGTTHFYLFSIDDFIYPSINFIREIVAGDPFQAELLYYGFILKYFPMMSFDIFKIYIRNEIELRTNFPDIELNISILDEKFSAEKKILNEKYFMLENLKEFPDLKRYEPKFSTVSPELQQDNIIDVLIKSGSSSIKTFKIMNMLSRIQINVRNLFEVFSLNNQIPMMRTRLILEHEQFILTKILKQENNNKINHKEPELKSETTTTIIDVQKIYEKVKDYLILNTNESILFIVIINAEGITPKDVFKENDALILTLKEDGTFEVKIVLEENIQLNFKEINEIIEKNINPVLERINEIGRTTFDSIRRLDTIKPSNIEFTDLSIDIIWKMPITRKVFNNICKELEKNVRSGIIKGETILNIEVITYKFFILKGIVKFDMKQYEKDVLTNNSYEYLSNSVVKQKWMQFFGQGKEITLSHRTADIKLEVNNLKEEEFMNFYYFIIVFFYTMEKNILTKQDEIEKVKKIDSSNILKLLKTRDPNLFDFEKYSSNVIYSRICQKQHQPIPYLPEEYDLLSDDLKHRSTLFWNYTTESPIYYLCPNKSNPHLNFLVGYHPRGYCLPCCKKGESKKKIKKSPTEKSPEGTEKSPTEKSPTEKSPEGTEKPPENTDEDLETKKQYIYKTCMDTHQYSEENLQNKSSRYIMIYGKTLEIGRIGQLPDILEKFFIYNLQDKEIIESSGNFVEVDIGNGLKKYELSILWKLVRNVKIFDEPLPIFNEVMQEKNILIDSDNSKLRSYISLKEILDSLIKDKTGKIIDSDEYPVLYDSIINADISEPVLLYKNKKTGKITVLDGIFRIGKEIINTKSNKTIDLEKIKIKVKYVTEKQLKRAEMEESEDKNNIHGGFRGGASLKKSWYFVYGVPQNNANITNIGALFAITAALKISPKEFIEKTIQFLGEKPAYFHTLLFGRLTSNFDSLDHFISTLTNLFLEEEIMNLTKFYLWNELFIDITRLIFEKHVIILEDKNVDISGTSTKAYNLTDAINIILPGKYESVEEIIPSESIDQTKNIKIFDSVNEYIILLQKPKKNKLYFEINKLYYPLFIFIPQLFFKEGIIEKRIFNNNDDIIKLIKNILAQCWSEQISDSFPTEIKISTLYAFMSYLRKNKTDCHIHQVFINSKNFIYAITLEIILKTNNIIFYFPIKYEFLSYIPDKYLIYEKDYKINHESTENKFPNLSSYISRDPFDRNIKNLVDYETFKEIVEEYNLFVVEESEEKGSFKVTKEELKVQSKLNQRESRVLTLYPLIKMQKLLIFKKNIIGIQSKNTLFYFQSYKFSNGADVEKVLDFFEKGYDLTDENYEKSIAHKKIRFLFYDPCEINKRIKDYITESSDTSVKVHELQSKFYEAIYHKYLYNIFVLELMNSFDKDKNNKLREELLDVLMRTNLNDTSQYNKLMNQLEEKLEEFPDDLLRIKNQLENTEDKKIFIQEFENMIYNFDRMNLNYLKKLSDKLIDLRKNSIDTGNKKIGNVSSKDSTELIEKIYDFIEKKVQKFVDYGDPDFKKILPKIENNKDIFIPCSEDKSEVEPYCKKGKLLISTKNIKNLINLFIDDISNPIKREYLFSSILINKIQNNFNFRKQANEEIYIRLT